MTVGAMEDESPSHGVRGRRRGRGRGYVTIGRGLHRLAAPEDVDGVELLRLDALAWQVLLPESACFGGLTSAQLRKWWLPPLPDALPLFVAQSTEEPASSRPELRVTRHPSTPAYDDVDGVRVMGAAETILACARDLRLLDLVVLIDCVLHHEWATLEELEEVAGRRRRGAPLMRKALTYADSRSESPYETLLRMLHVVCGIEVIPQYELFDEFGTLIAKGDLWLVGTKDFQEFDGRDHLPRRQQRKDHKRDRRIGAMEGRRRAYTKDDVLTQGITILRDADAAIGREHDPARIRPWHDLLRESMFTPAGLAAFCRRVGIDEPTTERTA